MAKKLLIVNTYGNMWSTGRIAAEIGDIAEKHGWQYRFAYAREANLEESRGIKITRSTLSGLLHTYLFSRILNLKGFGSIIDTWLFIREIKKFSPDLIHLHNIHTNYTKCIDNRTRVLLNTRVWVYIHCSVVWYGVVGVDGRCSLVRARTPKYPRPVGRCEGRERVLRVRRG